MSKTTKKVEKKELKQEMATTPQAFAVMKRCEDCSTPQDRVKPYDAMMGIGSISMSPDQVQGVYFEEKAALAEASKLHKLHEEDMKMLEEKKSTVINKLSDKIDALEAKRTKHFKAKNYDQEAEVASKIQELKDKLKKIEKATKLKKKSENSDSKKKLSEEINTKVVEGDIVIKTGGKHKGEKFRVFRAMYDGTYLLINLETGKKLGGVKPENIELETKPLEGKDKLDALVASHNFQYRNSEEPVYSKEEAKKREIIKLADELGLGGEEYYKKIEAEKLNK